MLTAQRTLQAQSRHPKNIKLDDQKIPFTFGKRDETKEARKEKVKKPSKQSLTAMVKAHWCRAVGYKREKK